MHDIKEIIERRKKLKGGIKNACRRAKFDKGKPKTLNESELAVNDSIKLMKTNHLKSIEDYSHKIRLLNSLSARRNPFADLVKISLLLNPREYELPEDYVPNIQFPGTSKKSINNSATREARLSSYSVKRAQELDRSNLPLILRTCYFCKKGWRKAPLINCDYCPLLYHADCIDPPLTTIPSTRWMCPNHVEPIAEEKLLASSSYCERVKLWNLFSKPINQESIKFSFLDKVHQNSNPASDGSTSSKMECQDAKCFSEEYQKFIVDMDNYERESDEGNELQEHQQQKDTSEQQYDPLINVTLRQMIESSKYLDSQENLSKNGDIKPGDNPSNSSTLDNYAKEKEAWLDFLQRLSNSKIDQNSIKFY